MKNILRLFLTGFTMGAADIVPGVSGGTIAFIFGIYEELIYSIKKLSGETLMLLLRGKIQEAFKSVPYTFLVPLGTGILLALLTIASVITYFLEHTPELLWSFFFGLIVASIIIVKNRVTKWSYKDVTAFIISTIGTYFLVGMVPVETAANPLNFFFAGVIAIIAMILPGISGSFLLILMGKYEQILNAVVERDILTLGLVFLGCAVGISFFSRVLSWLFSKHHDITIAILTGFMLGSLRKVWPFKETILTRINSHGIEVPIYQENIVPEVNMQLVFAIFLALIGGFVLIYLEKFKVTKEHLEDVEDTSLIKEHKKAIELEKK